MDYNELIRSELDPMVPYAPGLRASEVRERTGHENILKLSSNEHPSGPFPEARRAMRAILRHTNRYPDGSARALRGRLCEKLGVDDRHLAIGNGSNELIRLIAQAVLRPGDEVVYAWPSFVVYPMVTQMFGATAVPVPLNASESHDLNAMLAAVTDRTRLLFLCNPNNPTGTIYHKIAFDNFIKKVPDHVLVVVDEAYFEFVTDEQNPDALEYFDGERPIVSLRTFSKIYSLAAVRIGYGVMPEPLRLAVDKLREPFNVNSPAQIGAYYSLADDQEVERRKRENQEQKTYLYRSFDRLGVEYVPSEANFVYIKTEKPVEVFDALLEEGVIVRGFGN
ncbi:MAG: histidinol-phosphate transaminase, partial [Actinobacteria bacterium HGW-Actinobacteria-10]